MSQTDVTYRLTNSANINKVKKKEMIEEANEARMKRLNKKFMDPIFGVYPVYYCNVKSTI